MTSRISATSNGLPTSSLRGQRDLCFGGPRILSTASFSVSAVTVLPSIAVMMSPGLKPALAAGVSSIGETTLMMPFSSLTSMPRPPNSPLVWICMSLNALAFMSDYADRAGQHAVDRGFDQLLVVDGIDVFGADALITSPNTSSMWYMSVCVAVLGESAAEGPEDDRSQGGAGHERGADQ